MNDTEYLNSIDGLVESIIKESQTPYPECVNADELDW